MNTSPRTVTAALALAVSFSLAAPAHSSQAATDTGSRRVDHGAAHHARAAVGAVHVRVTVRKHRVTRSRTGFRPGNTVFDLRSRAGRSAMQLVRFRAGYTFDDFQRDLQSEDIEAIRRIDRKVVFYGGMPVDRKGVSHYGAHLGSGRYYLIDFDHPRWVRLRVEGRPQHRTLPRTTGSVDMVLDGDEHRFSTPRRLPRSGWLRQTNRTDEPHFMDMFKVKRSTTRHQVRRFFAGEGPAEPRWILGSYPGTFVVSPGHTVVWKYSYPRGKYLEVCFWPSDEDGTTHAEMGMWNFVTLH